MLLKLVFFILFFAKISYAYIDPGTGGYLLSSLWSIITGFFVFLLAILIHFFKYTLVRFYKKHKIFINWAFLIVFFFSILFLLIYFNRGSVFDPSFSGAHFYDNDSLEEGYYLFEGKLIDQTGKEIQAWNYSHLSYISSNGFYYAQEYFEAGSWGKFYFNGTPVWIKDNYPIHHEIIENPYSKNIFVLTKEVRDYKGRNVEFDVVAEFSPDGELISTWSTWDSLELLQGFHRKLELDKPKNIIIPENHRKNTSIWGGNYDYYHMNAISFVPPNTMGNVHPAFNQGNWIISFRHGSMVFILDKETKAPLWTGIYDQIEDNIEGQHSPQMLPDGKVLIFDNGRYRKQSRIIAIDPVTLDIKWEYKSKDFYTESQGFVQFLKDGNLLITESEDGRIFEITQQGKVIWEYYTPEKYNETNYKNEDKFGERKEIYRAFKYNKEFIDSLR